jgi:Helix-turn-helix domain
MNHQQNQHAQHEVSPRLNDDSDEVEERAMREALGTPSSAFCSIPWELVVAIRVLYDTGRWTQAELARRTGVNASHVSKIVNGRTRVSEGDPRKYVWS